MLRKITLLLIISVFFIGCSTRTEYRDVNISSDSVIPDEDVKVITDKIFVSYTNDMFYNPSTYNGQVVQLEGLIYVDYYFYEEGEFFVTRNTPGCCGDDGYAGLQIEYDEIIPVEGTWVTVKGVWQKSDYSSNGWALQVYSLEITEPGDEFLNTNY